MSGEGLLSLRQACKELGIGPATLKAFLEQEGVKVRRGKKKWYVPRAAVEQLKKGLLRSGEEAH